MLVVSGSAKNLDLSGCGSDVQLLITTYIKGELLVVVDETPSTLLRRYK